MYSVAASRCKIVLKDELFLSGRKMLSRTSLLERDRVIEYRPKIPELGGTAFTACPVPSRVWHSLRKVDLFPRQFSAEVLCCP